MSGSIYLLHLRPGGQVAMLRAPIQSDDGERALYRDGEPIPCRIERLTVGQSAWFTFFKAERLADAEYLVSNRLSSTVVSIEEIDGHQERPQ
ncbi:hypothetical protein ASE14_09620 [Agromyces sp. Root81]|nr:hypothetical protein ASE14_09620 [Agromyces sp. Root81]